MGQEKIESLSVDKMARDLSAFAIDRTDLKELLSLIPADSNLNMTTIEYELQLLKILSVGWALSFFMPQTDKSKGLLTRIFWENIREISGNISTLTQTTTGKFVDYFGILKERLNTYLEALQKTPETSQNPAVIIGPVFASACFSDNNPAVILTGTKMFALTLGAVKDYLNAVKIDDIKLN
ncbi:MAG: hypothetical protein A2277_07490 [Desulfobacterales bacterium RIFOXYA12_FULL_46_15]|nr:MAG: hypothetical protein A2097_13800 [Desulfobacula sp. GWF2_41_7]OGR28494.1 MAG: hypothetical protein A2277_07490 [Desulfobacterales bacterium RIFOXYA12_FULL_46_15]